MQFSDHVPHEQPLVSKSHTCILWRHIMSNFHILQWIQSNTKTTLPPTSACKILGQPYCCCCYCCPINIIIIYILRHIPFRIWMVIRFKILVQWFILTVLHPSQYQLEWLRNMEIHVLNYDKARASIMVLWLNFVHFYEHIKCIYSNACPNREYTKY